MNLSNSNKKIYYQADKQDTNLTQQTGITNIQAYHGETEKTDSNCILLICVLNHLQYEKLEMFVCCLTGLQHYLSY